LFNYISIWRNSPIARSIRILSIRDRRKIIAATILQVLLSALDLLGVLAIGLLGALSLAGQNSENTVLQVESALSFFGISSFDYQSQIIIIGGSAIALLVGRTLLSIIFTRRIMFFLGRRGAKLSTDLITRLLSRPILEVQSRTIQETLFAVTRGVEFITYQILATSVVLISDLALLIIMSIGLFAIDSATAIGTISMFSLVGFFLYRYMHVRAGILGLKSSLLNIESNEKIVEVFSSFRESVVRNRRDFYVREIGGTRYQVAETASGYNFLPFVGKYVIETAVILGALLIGAIQFLIGDAANAIPTLGIFLAAASRIAPAVMRVQQASIAIKGAIGQAGPTLDLIDSLGSDPIAQTVMDALNTQHEGFNSTVEVQQVNFTYPSKFGKAITDVSFSIMPGSFVAFVGPSGAGKTTIIDVLLGVLVPDEGSVLISGLPPIHAVAKWPGAVAYVPQDVVIAAGTIRENVSLGYPQEYATSDLVLDALRVAQLENFVTELPLGIDTQVGERGTKISGGQRQRLGIARAMFTRPQLLVLDEATSSLDGETEASISESIQELRGSTTIIMIAHRLSTVKNADLVVYMNQGRIEAMGTFEEVRSLNSDFDRQAGMMGL
jgi:ABC-type multidrug transport system fused ATPase/permease subunit